MSGQSLVRPHEGPATMRAMPQRAPSVGFVSLGCPKALVDSERIMTNLRQRGYALAPDYSQADLVVVNTCGFIDSAIEESLQAIDEALNESGRVIVTGCLGANAKRIREQFPAVLEITGPHAYDEVTAAVDRHLPMPHDPYTDLVPPQGLRLTPRHYAYLKISEGCNNRCSFCIIPALRGRLTSRRIDDVMSEAETLIAAGVRELLVISQDTSAYGADIRYAQGRWRDRNYDSRIVDLAKALGELGVWIRLHYVYPYPHVDELLPLMSAGRILPYLDIPFQHGSPAVLKRMRRPAHSEDTLRRIADWRSVCPQLSLRSSFIVGFPGETDAEFEELLQWLEAAQLDRVGCFRYSPVDGAAANALGAQVDADVVEERYALFMQTAQRISRARLARHIGERIEVLVDAHEGDDALARSRGDAPEIDGIVRIVGGARLPVGEFANVEVTAADDYDLLARPARANDSNKKRPRRRPGS
ncbi:MAG: 30S ribosomal protein S12 methylthiotransferase RimO [Steroidobacteraceae bacterium]